MKKLANSKRRRTRGVIILGTDPLSPETLAAAEACDEVFVLARAVAEEDEWVVDEERAYARARDRIEELRRRLGARGVVVRGTVVSGSVSDARKDAEALYPAGTPL